MGKQQVIAKGLEVNSSWYVQTAGGGKFVTLSPDYNFYPNYLALVSEFCADIVAAYPEHRLYIVNDGDSEGYVAYFLGATDTIGSGDLTAYAPLGFDGTEASEAKTINGITGNFCIANNRPLDAWYPSYYTSDARYFEPNNDSFFGVVGVDGNLSGASYTERESRNLEWKFQTAENTIPSIGTSNESDRCFINVINDVRKNTLSISDSNEYCKGVYFIDDISVFYPVSGQPYPIPDTFDSGSQKGDYFFCSTGAPIIKDASIDNTKKWFDISLKLTSAVAPDWDSNS